MYAAKAMSWMVFDFCGAPLTENLPGSHSRSSSATSEQVGRDLPRLVADLARRHGAGRAGRRRGPAGVGAEAVGGGVGVALLDLDVLGRDAQLLGDDLGVGRLVPLALRLGAEAGDGLAGGMHPDLGRVEHLEAEDVEVLRGPGPDDLGEAGDADAHELAALALLGLLPAQLGVADHVHRLLERGGVVAAVVLPPEDGLVRECLGRNEVLHP